VDKRHAVRAAIAFLLFGLLAPAVQAQEPGFDPWAGGPEGRRDPIDALDEEEEMQRWRGGPEGPDYFATHLYRCRMNALDSAQYSIAELLLQRGDAKGAIATLEAVLPGTQDEFLRGLTQFNIAEIYRRRLLDADSAAACYRKVEGPLRHKASQRLLNILADQGKADEAAKATEELLAKAREKGEKLALLHRLAAVYKSHKMPDRALAVYQRIAKEFTPDDLKEMTQAIEQEVGAAIERIRAAERGREPADVERLQRQLHEGRPRELRAAGRWDEFFAYQRALQRGFRQMQQMDREAEAREQAEDPRREAVQREREARERAQPRRREGERPPEERREEPKKADF